LDPNSIQHPEEEEEEEKEEKKEKQTRERTGEERNGLAPSRCAALSREEKR